MTRSPTLYDISPPLSPRMPVWPGDAPLSRKMTSEIALGERVTSSTFCATAHLGAHADAPAHYGAGGATIDQCALEPYLGPCRLIEVSAPRGEWVPHAALAAAAGAERVLVRTASYWGRGPEKGKFIKDFNAFDPEGIQYLAEMGVRLVGIDTPSVDLFHRDDLPAHEAFLRHDLRILEGLDLRGVPPGDYELIALPLKLVGFDGSPVRAVLKVS